MVIQTSKDPYRTESARIQNKLNEMVSECPPLIKCKKRVIDNKMCIVYNIKYNIFKIKFTPRLRELFFFKLRTRNTRVEIIYYEENFVILKDSIIWSSRSNSLVSKRTAKQKV